MASDISPDGCMIATTDYHKIRLYNITIKPESVEQIKEAVLESIGGALHLKFTPCSTKLIVAGTNGKLYILDLNNYNLVSIDEFHKGRYITKLAISPCGQWLISGDANNRLGSYSLKHFKVNTS
jgi:U3 small nucleolar RNA-associated protein 4